MQMPLWLSKVVPTRAWKFIEYHKARLQRLESAVELHIDQHRAPAIERLAQEVCGLGHGPGAFCCDAERARQPDEIDFRVYQFHAHITVGLFGKSTQGVQPLFENAIGAVVEDDERNIDAVMCGGPQRLARVHG